MPVLYFENTVFSVPCGITHKVAGLLCRKPSSEHAVCLYH